MSQEEKYKIKLIIEELEKLIEPKQNKKSFNPSKEQIERWKKISPTKATVDLLSKKGFGSKEITEVKTQYNAHIILENLKEENI